MLKGQCIFAVHVSTGATHTTRSLLKEQLLYFCCVPNLAALESKECREQSEHSLLVISYVYMYSDRAVRHVTVCMYITSYQVIIHVDAYNCVEFKGIVCFYTFEQDTSNYVCFVDSTTIWISINHLCTLVLWFYK